MNNGIFTNLNDNVEVEVLGVQTQRVVEGRSLVVIQVHGDVHLQGQEDMDAISPIESELVF